MFSGRQGLFGSKTVDTKTLEYFMATGLGSRGGPNKVSNKLRRCPKAYLATLEYLMATGLRSRGGPNKVSNKLKRCPSSYYLFN
jgi:hypothetical protein